MVVSWPARAFAQISVPSGSSITAGNVTLTASTTGPQSFNPTTLLSDLGLTGASSLLNFDPSTISPATLLADINPLIYLGSIATVTEQANITASGNISIVADATNDAGLTQSFGSDELLFHLTEAIALVGGREQLHPHLGGAPYQSARTTTAPATPRPRPRT